MIKKLIIDPSSEHMAYVICEIKDNSFIILESGMIWCPSSWKLGCKLAYIYRCIEYIVLNNSITEIITEKFFAPFKNQAGTSVIPTINNNLLMFCCNLERETQTKITVRSLGSGEWRKLLGSGSIRDLKTGKRDFKTPCRDKVIQYLGKILPENIISNTNLKERKLPHDVSDALGIAVAVALEARYPKIVASPDLFNNPHTVSVLHSLI